MTEKSRAENDRIGSDMIANIMMADESLASAFTDEAPAAAPLRVVILGATSAIAEAVARLYAVEGAALVLVARQNAVKDGDSAANGSRLSQIAADLRLRGAAQVETVTDDLAVADAAAGRLDAIMARIGGADHIILAYGALGEQLRAEHDFVHAAEIINVNFASATAWALAAAAHLEKQGSGSLVALGAAADNTCGRNNYIYGAAKAGLAALITGIAHRFGDSGPRAVVVKPGPTETPMTAGAARGSLGFLWSTPAQIAVIVRRAADHGGAEVYAPGFWRAITCVRRALPSPVFDKLNI
jgi:decaprenylphospho-beta-D-erythro-pentofuranosid-2-ulose 2-reductase